jgi:hypothetical protein
MAVVGGAEGWTNGSAGMFAGATGFGVTEAGGFWVAGAPARGPVPSDSVRASDPGTWPDRAAGDVAAVRGFDGFAGGVLPSRAAEVVPASPGRGAERVA